MRIVNICAEEAHKIGRKEYSLEDILNDVCVTMGQPLKIIKSKDRHREYAICRQIYCYVSRTCTKHPLQKIADVAGYGDHTTVVKNSKKVRGWISHKDSVFMPLWEKYKDESNVWPYIS